MYGVFQVATHVERRAIFIPPGSVLQFCALAAREERQRKIGVFQEMRDEISMLLRLLLCPSHDLCLGF